jgi:hypothetical protein
MTTAPPKQTVIRISPQKALVRPILADTEVTIVDGAGETLYTGKPGLAPVELSKLSTGILKIKE